MALEFGQILLKSQKGLAGVVTFWPAAGLFLATLVLTPRRSSWPGMVAAASLASLVSDVLVQGLSVAVSLGFIVARCGEAVLGTLLLRRLVTAPVAFSRIAEVVGFVTLAVVVGPVWGATVGTGVIALSGEASFGPVYWAWWTSDALGVLVIAPVMLTAAGGGQTRLRGLRPWRIAECGALFVGLTLIDLAVYRDVLPPPWNVPTFILPFLLWAAVRFNPAVTSLAILLIAVIGSGSVVRGYGPFAALSPDPGAQILRAQGTLAVIAVSVLLLAAVVAERKLAERQKATLIQELERALTEIKTLQGLIPLCSWCRKIRDDQGYWQSLEVYMSEHFDAKITHGICPMCVEVNFSDVSPPTPKRPPPAGGGATEVGGEGSPAVSP